MRKIDCRHSACLCRHWEVWKYHRSIDKWKCYKLRKRYEVTKRYKVTKKVLSYKKVRSYEKGTKLRKRYKVTRNVTKLRTWYEVTKKVRRCYEISTKDLGYEVTKLRDSNATYRDNLLWRIVMHFGEMPWATLGLSDLRSQVAIFGEWNIYGTRKKIILLNFKPVTRIWKKKTFSWQKVEKQ
jgi:hypothetical protein